MFGLEHDPKLDSTVIDCFARLMTSSAQPGYALVELGQVICMAMRKAERSAGHSGGEAIVGIEEVIYLGTYRPLSKD